MITATFHLSGNIKSNLDFATLLRSQLQATRPKVSTFIYHQRWHMLHRCTIDHRHTIFRDMFDNTSTIQLYLFPLIHVDKLLAISE